MFWFSSVNQVLYSGRSTMMCHWCHVLHKDVVMEIHVVSQHSLLVLDYPWVILLPRFAGHYLGFINAAWGHKRYFLLQCMLSFYLFSWWSAVRIWLCVYRRGQRLDIFSFCKNKEKIPRSVSIAHMTKSFTSFRVGLFGPGLKKPLPERFSKPGPVNR
jgi:hypothetical protein